MKNNFNLIRFLKYIKVLAIEYRLLILICSLVLFVITNIFVSALTLNQEAIKKVEVFVGFAMGLGLVSSGIITLVMSQNSLSGAIRYSE